MADPKPLKPTRTLSGKRTIAKTNARGVEGANLFEANRWMARITLKKFKIFVSEISNILRKLPIVKPKVRVSKVIHSGVQRPA